MVASNNTIRFAALAAALPLVLGSALPPALSMDSSILRRQELNTWEAYDQDSTGMAEAGLCRFYLDVTDVDGLEPCLNYCDNDSITCNAAIGQGAPIKKNPDGARYALGECWCSNPELETLVNFTAEGLKDLSGITCAVWLQALKESVNLSTWLIPDGAGAAAKVAKKVLKSIKKAEKLGGKDGWTNFIADTCGIEDWDFDISKAFDLGIVSDVVL